ncbi:Thiosulfate sulfurtransferase/rhodanese-like domain-containing protein 3 [Nibea albiflora]|uniref:Thiosulfate sulfurtransferase/rhodanese-like domain-containing protein 3 n=1 Tax=Nibea albiflora TaxID=240163 RepID=A0ACB7F8W5_NIBAL|nr:Thiosulfate sulfurtransferase/rhodanese-like domain-containing protein 3 [Nibea albiflora]
MLSCLLSRSLCQVVAEVNRRSYPTFGPAFRAFTTSGPQRGAEASDNGSVVTYSQLKSMLSNHDVQLFDVRNPDEYQAGRISSAVNIPYDDNIVFHCRSGNRSAKALDIARHLGFSRVRHYKGGYSEWEERERQ